ncbi:putative Glutamic acid alanine rich protein of Trypanosoma [Trypanosoma vivax]|uniref:Trypanosoma glutamic acid/alanine-rich protein domain-containing protein n=1 Tax=Trypanosoma vivax (strain Y486) TaxID=1055687 RepID=G0U8I9_TRYVY|nr:putative Glutamic acid alanine rich protein of Trypanosoma [Trypanosoma vivax]CCC53915.1 hypothetical protein TVY486_1113990 [Trypanosoma vivax Y486]
MRGVAVQCLLVFILGVLARVGFPEGVDVSASHSLAMTRAVCDLMKQYRGIREAVSAHERRARLVVLKALEAKAVVAASMENTDGVLEHARAAANGNYGAPSFRAVQYVAAENEAAFKRAAWAAGVAATSATRMRRHARNATLASERALFILDKYVSGILEGSVLSVEGAGSLLLSCRGAASRVTAKSLEDAALRLVALVRCKSVKDLHPYLLHAQGVMEEVDAAVRHINKADAEAMAALNDASETLEYAREGSAPTSPRRRHGLLMLVFACAVVV